MHLISTVCAVNIDGEGRGEGGLFIIIYTPLKLGYLSVVNRGILRQKNHVFV